MEGNKFKELFDKIGLIQQIPDECNWIYNHVEALNPSVVIEVGVSNGGSLRLWLEAMKKNGLAIGVDVCPQATVKPLISEISKDKNIKVHLIIGLAEDPKTIEKVKNILKKKKADFLFIDALHTEEAVKRDFENYSPFVRKGGLVGFHDIGVYPEFWRHLKGNKQSLYKTLSTGVLRKDYE